MKNSAEKIDQQASELLDFVTYKVSQVHPKLNAQAAHVLRKHAGLSLLQWRIIALLKTFGPGVPSVEIINQVNMDKGLFSRTLKALVLDQFVDAKVDTQDQRRQLLSLSHRGHETYDRIITTMRKRQEFLLHDVTVEERAALFSALDKLEANSKRRDF